MNDADLIVVGVMFSCASSTNLFKCWGRDDEGVNNVPVEIASGNVIMASAWSHVCARTNSDFKCWGTYTEL